MAELSGQQDDLFISRSWSLRFSQKFLRRKHTFQTPPDVQNFFEHVDLPAMISRLRAAANITLSMMVLLPSVSVESDITATRLRFYEQKCLQERMSLHYCLNKDVGWEWQEQVEDFVDTRELSCLGASCDSFVIFKSELSSGSFRLGTSRRISCLMNL